MIAHEQEVVARHFDQVAKEYDYWKSKNKFYYDRLYAIVRKNTAGAKTVLDVGCGTGALLRASHAPRALGIDVSDAMVALARERNRDLPDYRFEHADITTWESSERFDAVLFFDVIEHVPDRLAAIQSLARVLAPGGRLVIEMANPAWEPILMFAERRGLKMPEGPHYRIWGGELLRLAEQSGLKLIQREWHLIFPKYIPYVSWFLNDVIGRLPIVRRLAVIEVFVFTKA